MILTSFNEPGHSASEPGHSRNLYLIIRCGKIHRDGKSQLEHDHIMITFRFTQFSEIELN